MKQHNNKIKHLSFNCWHVFQEKNVLVIDGKNNSDDTQKIDGKNNSKENNSEDTQKSAEEDNRPQSLDREREGRALIGLRGHVVRDHHFTDSRAGEVKGESCRNSRYAKSQNDLSRWIQRTRGERSAFR
jgi:hypothetical protein